MRRQVTAACVAVVWMTIAVLAFPGLDEFGEHELTTPEEIAKLQGELGKPATQAAIAVADLNRAFRLPLVKRITPVQRPFRIAQGWSLYTSASLRVGRLEVYVNDVLKYRSGDSEHRWLRGVFRNRRLRPVVETTVHEDEPRNWRGLVRLVANRAQRDFAGTTGVRLVTTVTNFPDRRRPAPPKATFTASEPDWHPVRTK